jgi:O-6-methylguanine DNA methyltransferase
MKMYRYISSPVGLLEMGIANGHLFQLHFTDAKRYEESADPLFDETEKQLNAYFAGTLQQFDLPMEQEGTDFQQKVWKELLAIPFGKTISYLELSKRIGDVKAIRAVGTTNGKNNIAIIYPCHRVIGSDGSLTGYAGGLHRKQWLLKHERELIFGKQEELF